MTQPRGKSVPTYMYESVVRDLGDPHTSRKTEDVVQTTLNFAALRGEMMEIINRPFEMFARAMKVTSFQRAVDRNAARDKARQTRRRTG